jgi:copper transport protein
MIRMRLLIGGLLALLAPSVFAHAVLLGSSPNAEQVLDAAPQEVVLNFNENVGPIFFRVLDATGTEVGSAGEIRVDGNDVFLPLADVLDNGTYIVSYRVISADTHPVGASFLFAVGEPIAATNNVADAGGATSGWRLPVALNRWLLYAAGTLAAGSGLLLVLLNLSGGALTVAQRQGRWAAILTIVALLIAPGVGGAEMLAAGVGGLFSSATWGMGLGSTLGPSALIGVPGALLLWFALGKQRPAAGLLLLGAALVIGSYLVTGHAATAAPAWVMAFVVGCHLLAVAFWFAALWPLRQGVTELQPIAAAELLEAFSGRGVWAVGLLGLSGIVISWVQMQGLTPFLTTDYGNRLLVKLCLVVLVIGLALMNKLRLTAKVRAATDGGVESLRQSIKGEYVIIVLIIGLAMSLTLPSPPRAMVAGAGGQTSMAGGFSTEVTKGDLTAKVDVTPARPGENMIMIAFKDGQGNPLALQELRIFLSLPAASLEGIEKVGEAMSPGMYHFMSGEMIIPGEWAVRIDAYVDDFDKRILKTNITIQ